MKKTIFASLCLGVVLYSCSPRYYTPSTQNVPLFTTQGEGSVYFSTNTSQYEVQAAYAMSDKLALQLNGGFFSPQKLDNGDGGSGSFGEVGIGYYRSLSESVIFETYGLVGFGKVRNEFPSSVQDHPTTTGKISANLLRIGLQPSIGYKTENFNIALSSRIANLSYNNITGDLIFDSVPQREYLSDNSSNLLIEPAITIGGGKGKLRVQVQAGYSINASNSDFRQNNGYITVGLGTRW